MREPSPRPLRYYQTRFKKGGPLVPIKFTIEQEIDPETGELMADEIVSAEGPDGPVNPDWVEETCHEISETKFWNLQNLRNAVPEMHATHVALDLRHTIVMP